MNTNFLALKKVWGPHCQKVNSSEFWRDPLLFYENSLSYPYSDTNALCWAGDSANEYFFSTNTACQIIKANTVHILRL